MHHSNPSSDAGSVKSGSPSSHSYKKSLSSKADPNTALTEDQTCMFLSYPLVVFPSIPEVCNANELKSVLRWSRIYFLPPFDATH